MPRNQSPRHISFLHQSHIGSSNHMSENQEDWSSWAYLLHTGVGGGRDGCLPVFPSAVNLEQSVWEVAPGGLTGRETGKESCIDQHLTAADNWMKMCSHRSKGENFIWNKYVQEYMSISHTHTSISNTLMVKKISIWDEGHINYLDLKNSTLCTYEIALTFKRMELASKFIWLKKNLERVSILAKYGLSYCLKLMYLTLKFPLWALATPCLIQLPDNTTWRSSRWWLKY